MLRAFASATGEVDAGDASAPARERDRVKAMWHRTCTMSRPSRRAISDRLRTAPAPPPPRVRALAGDEGAGVIVVVLTVRDGKLVPMGPIRRVVGGTAHGRDCNATRQ